MNEFNTIEDLSGFLNKANTAYREGKSLISDREFDELEDQLRKVDPENSVLQEIQDDSFDSEKPLTINMGSQDKALNLEEMESYYRRTKKDFYLVSEKLDGMSAEFTYKDGNLSQVLTRGNGKIGVDITAVAKDIPNLPKTIKNKGLVIVRGEIMMTKSSFERLNIQLQKENKDPLKNTRNGAVSIVKTLKNRAYALFLSVKAFDIEIL